MPNSTIIKLAILAARKSEHAFRVGAVLFQGANPVEFACNTAQTIGYRKDVFGYEPTRHAEMNVLHNVPRENIEGRSLLVVRIDSKGNLTNSKPCKACYAALRKTGIKRVYYSDYDGQIKRLDLDTPLEVYVKDRK